MNSPRLNGDTPRKVTIISPHFDDVPLSLGESIRSGALRGLDIRVRIVFGRTNWTTWMHPTASRAAAVSLWRRAEETAASTVFGYRWSAAGWEEVVLRTGEMDSSAFIDPDGNLDDDPILDQLVEWLGAVSNADNAGEGSGSFRRRSGPPEMILVPAGMGGHRDHRLITRAATLVMDEAKPQIGFYEDRPYSSYLTQAQRDEHMAGICPGLVSARISGPIRRSTQLLARACYPSQMSSYFTEAMNLDRLDGGPETVWFSAGTAPEWLSRR